MNQNSNKVKILFKEASATFSNVAVIDEEIFVTMTNEKYAVCFTNIYMIIFNR